MSAECSIIERHKILKIVLNCSKFVQISKLGFIFGLWGWASFLSVDWLSACSDSEMTSTSSPYTPSSTINWPHHLCVPAESYQIERVVCHHCFTCAMGLSPVPVCQPCQKCASVPEGHPWSVCASLDVSWRFQQSKMSWRPRCCATVPDGSKSTRLYLCLWFVCNDDFSVFFSLMWWPIGCVCHH